MLEILQSLKLHKCKDGSHNATISYGGNKLKANVKDALKKTKEDIVLEIYLNT